MCFKLQLEQRFRNIYTFWYSRLIVTWQCKGAIKPFSNVLTFPLFLLVPCLFFKSLFYSVLLLFPKLISIFSFPTFHLSLFFLFSAFPMMTSRLHFYFSYKYPSTLLSSAGHSRPFEVNFSCCLLICFGCLSCSPNTEHSSLSTKNDLCILLIIQFFLEGPRRWLYPNWNCLVLRF